MPRVRRRLPPLNERLKMDGRVLLAAIDTSSAAMCFLDPQYRAVLDKMKFGNEGARQKARAELKQMDDGEIAWFFRECVRVLRPGGHVVLWLDKFSIGEGLHLRWSTRALLPVELVDLIAWNKMRIGMGKRTRRTTEYAVVFQKRPARADAWHDRRLPDSWPEHADQSIHPHAKPHVLTDRLIRAVTKRGDLVVDPCAGGFGVLEACRLNGRNFIGCDLEG